MSDPFDLFKRRSPINTRPHIVAPDSVGRESHCINCGATGWDIALRGGACDPNSDGAREFRKAKRDGMVGRITGNSVK
jgi:hypothetical protein